MGIKKMMKVQLGRETTAGTAVAATAIWRGTGAPEDKRVIEFPEEDVGYLGGTDRSECVSIAGAITLSQSATFEQIGYPFQAGVKKVTSPTTDTGGSGRVYTYTFPTTTVPAINTDISAFTIEGGDNVQAQEMAYCVCETIRITGRPNELLQVESDWFGREWSNTTFTGAISLPSVSGIPFNKGALYIDTAGGTLGTTLKSATLLGMELEVKTGWKPVPVGNGQLYFGFTKNVGSEVRLRITFEHNSDAETEIAAWRAQTARLIRVEFEGTALQTAGSSYDSKTLRIDLAGKWVKFDPLGDNDGNTICVGEFLARHNATANKYAEVIVVNELASLP